MYVGDMGICVYYNYGQVVALLCVCVCDCCDIYIYTHTHNGHKERFGTVQFSSVQFDSVSVRSGF